MFVCICLIGLSSGSEFRSNDLELSTKEKNTNKGFAIIFALCGAVMTAARYILIRKFQAKNYPDFDRAFDACLLLGGFYSIVFIFTVYHIGINLHLIFVGTCAGMCISLARILTVISVATGNGAVCNGLIGSWSIW